MNKKILFIHVPVGILLLAAVTKPWWTKKDGSQWMPTIREASQPVETGEIRFAYDPNKKKGKENIKPPQKETPTGKIELALPEPPPNGAGANTPPRPQATGGVALTPAEIKAKEAATPKVTTPTVTGSLELNTSPKAEPSQPGSTPKEGPTGAVGLGTSPNAPKPAPVEPPKPKSTGTIALPAGPAPAPVVAPEAPKPTPESRATGAVQLPQQGKTPEGVNRETPSTPSSKATGAIALPVGQRPAPQPTSNQPESQGTGAVQLPRDQKTPAGSTVPSTPKPTGNVTLAPGKTPTVENPPPAAGAPPKPKMTGQIELKTPPAPKPEPKTEKAPEKKTGENSQPEEIIWEPIKKNP